MQIPSEETKKATLPIEPSNASAIEEEDKQAPAVNNAADDDEGEDDEEEEVKGQPKPTKILNQKYSNIPIATPEIEEFKKLLEMNASHLKLKPQEKALLMSAIEKGTFAKTAQLIISQMRANQEYDRISALEDVIPLFEPHMFWDNQPVPKPTDELTLQTDEFDKPIENKTVDEISPEPYALPAQYEWDNLDLANDEVAQEVYELLVKNYVEDDDAMFRFDYSIPFLRWALLPPNGHADWLVGIRAGKRRKLFGMITAIPVNMMLKG